MQNSFSYERLALKLVLKKRHKSTRKWPISIDFDEFISPFSPQFKFRLRRFVRHKTHCLTSFPKASKFIKNTPLRVVFSTLFSGFGNVAKLDFSCLYNLTVQTITSIVFLMSFHYQHNEHIAIIFLKQKTKHISIQLCFAGIQLSITFLSSLPSILFESGVMSVQCQTPDKKQK